MNIDKAPYLHSPKRGEGGKRVRNKKRPLNTHTHTTQHTHTNTHTNTHTHVTWTGGSWVWQFQEGKSWVFKDDLKEATESE